MTVAWDAANWVAEQSQVHDFRDVNQILDVSPVGDVVVVKVQEPQLSHLLESLGRGQRSDIVVTQVDLFQIVEI